MTETPVCDRCKSDNLYFEAEVIWGDGAWESYYPHRAICRYCDQETSFSFVSDEDSPTS